jgi:5'(3')-deoxyribonucleotidase
MKKRVAFDLDGTLADYMGAAVPLLKEYYDLEPDFTKSDAYKIEEVFGLTPETRPPDMRKHLYEDLRMFSDLAPLAGMSTMTELLHDKDVKIYVITARTPTPTVVEDTWRWLEKHGFVVDDVFFTGDKAALCNMMGVRVIMEDELGQIIRLRNAGVDVVISDQPWNRTLPDDPHQPSGTIGRIARASSWKEALRLIKEFLA